MLDFNKPTVQQQVLKDFLSRKHAELFKRGKASSSEVDACIVNFVASMNQLFPRLSAREAFQRAYDMQVVRAELSPENRTIADAIVDNILGEMNRIYGPKVVDKNLATKQGLAISR